MAKASLTGQSLGNYRVLEPLGRGGMARVYRAYHPKLDRYVAIKVLRSDLVEDEKFLIRFRREAQLVAGLRHANIIQVFDFDAQDELYFMVMELLEGDTLKTRLNDYRIQEELMPLGEVVRVLLDVLDGLAYAHDAGMIHRDIKPANILLTKRGEAVLSDFGIAHIVGSTQHTATSALMGTLNYMAPEQGLKGKSDACSDIYALGIVLYEMLTQRPPFEADTPLAVLMKHINDPLPPPCEINPDIPKSFEQIVLKALAKAPEDRYQSAREMAQTLKDAANEAEIELPARISLPLSFTTDEAPSESVIVLSGTAREKITEAEFASQDTDESLEQRIDFEALNEKGFKNEGKELSLREDPTSTGAGPTLKAIGLFLIINSFAILVAEITGQWEIYNICWPMELFLTACVLSGAMISARSIWLMIPVGIISGNGLLFLYCTITGLWRHWNFLWVFEVWLLIGVIWWTVKTGGEKGRNRRLSYRWGKVLMILLPLLSLSALALSIIITTTGSLAWLFGI